MPEHRRKFSPQFRAEAVQMVIETGRPNAEVARDRGIHDGTLGNWVNAWRREHPEPDQALSPVERARVKELEEENRRLRMENEFLKGSGLLRADAPVAQRCAVIDAERATYRISWMCRAPGRAPLQLLCLAQPGRDCGRGRRAICSGLQQVAQRRSWRGP
jgi:transposase-like protein